MISDLLGHDFHCSNVTFPVVFLCVTLLSSCFYQAAEVASRIHQKKEMGCKALDVVYVEENHPNESRAWRAMELEEKPKVNKGN